MLRSKAQALRLLALCLLISGTLLTLVLLAGAADPAEEGAIVLEFRNVGTADSAVGFRIITDSGGFTIFITRDGYLSVSATTPDWRSFPHIAPQRNRLLLAAGENQRNAILYVNGERAWNDEIGVVEGCRVVTLGAARVEWLVVDGCEGANL